ncbi:Glyoxylate/hydroxypyruvate reductase B (modular protein) [Burkholderiales bacterium 8X]|nr:Glyoxylate/hydroxypyruvate reductase B (modular protein) [Burkholderiales bacterium 8X]
MPSHLADAEPSFDVAVFGEAMLLLVADTPGPIENASSFYKRTAGAETNVAIGLSRLGLKVGWASRLGTDSMGRALLGAMQQEGIDCSKVVCDPSQRTGFQFKGRVTDGSDPPVEYHRKGSAASHMGPADVDAGWLSSARHLHATGVFAAISDTSLQAALKCMEVMRAAGRTISFDTNLRPTLWSSTGEMRRWINELASRADWVMPGIEEGLLLTGESSPEGIAAFYRRRGASLVVVKLGPDGAYYDSASAGTGRIEGFPVEKVIDTVGAGDGFAAGLVSALLEGRSVPEAVRRGAWIGARAVQVLGDTEGLPTRAELDASGIESPLAPPASAASPARTFAARKNVLVFRELPEDQLARLREAHEVTIANPRVPAEQAAFDAALPMAHGLIGSSQRIDDALLARAPRLEVVSSVSVGVDNYALSALHARGIVLCHTPGVLDETVADTVFGLLMATSRRIVELSNLVREGRWTRNIGEDSFGFDVHGKTLGLLGFGRIGQAIARRAALGFGMKVLYHARHEVDLKAHAPQLQGKATHTPLGELLAASDFVVAMLPLSESTRGMLDARVFEAMRPGAIFVNGGRGATVDEADLLAALDSGHLRAAGLDVFAQEPLPQESPLRTHPRVTPLPHIGSATHETRHAMAELATTNLLKVLAGEKPLTPYDTSLA